jgi:tetratricopeptide (TPR) repeat protein
MIGFQTDSMRTNSLPHRTGYSLALRILTIALLMLGAITAARLSYAEFVAGGDAPESLARAARLAPNADYLERLSERLSELHSGGTSDLEPDHASEGETNAASAGPQREQRASDALRLALVINPRSSSAWITLGLAAERERDFTEAARDLEQAARVDRQYLPAWTLANYYFRRADRPLFWKWARRAAALAYDDLAPLLTLADRLEPGRATQHLAPSPKLERAYLDLLIGENRFDDAQSVARKILARTRAGRGSAEDLSRLRGFTARLIAAKRGADALEIWSGISTGPTPVGGLEIRDLRREVE